MDVKTLCLGLLSFGDACGYDLKKRFEQFFHHFYSAGFGSIYPALAELAARGHVTCVEPPGEGRPDRKVYRITPAGRAAFLESLRTTEPQHKLRSEFLAMLYFAELMDPARLEDLLRTRMGELQVTLERIAALDQEWGPDAPVGARFVAGFGAALARAARQYIEEHRDALLRAARPVGEAPSQHRGKAIDIGQVA